MSKQLSFFPGASFMPSGAELSDAGIIRAVEHADQLQKKWSDDALLILREFLSRTDQPFMTEELRGYAEKVRNFKAPASSTAWGGVMRRAKAAGLIECIGIGQVKNAKAHAANAAIWKTK